MKKITLFVAFLAFFGFANSQNKNATYKFEIKKVLHTFMECLVKKDSTKFYNLFYTDPVSWVGVTQQKSFFDELKKDSTAKDNFADSYKLFYRNFFDKEIEEKFSNVVINTDGYIATVFFDYNFWYKNKKLNWGKESWTLIRTNGKWKITSVIFSLQYEAIQAEPKSNKATKY